MKHLEFFDDRDRALGMLHLYVVEYRNLPEAERYCDRFIGEPETEICLDFLSDQLWGFELTDEELYSYALFLQVNMEEQYLEILRRQ